MNVTKQLIDKFLNHPLVLDVYPMVDRIESEVVWDGDEEYPMYKIYLEFYLNDPTITGGNMYEKKFDPHYLIDKHLMDMLRLAGIKKSSIENYWIKVFSPTVDLIYPSFS